MSLLTIIIVTYNSSKYISPCLISIRKYYEENLKSGEINVKIFDNKSEDNTLSIVEKEINKFSDEAKKNIEILGNRENIGFANGVNTVSKKTETPYILLLNPDAEFENNNLLSAVSFLKNNQQYAVLGAKILDSRGKEEPSAGVIYTFLPFLSMLTGTEEFFKVRNSPSRIKKTGFVSGGCMLLDNKIFKEMGGFDKNLFMYMEDMEYCLRLSKKGLEVVFYPDLIVSHASHGSSGRPYAIAAIYKGVSYLYKKHMRKLSGTVNFLLACKAYILVFAGKISNNEYLVTAYEKALSEITN